MENVFLTHRWGLGMGLGHVMCKGGQLFFVDCHCLTFLCESVCKYLHLLRIVSHESLVKHAEGN